MSRRTKLLITALFAVLLAVPVVYLCLSWSPREPLRFRLVSLQEQPTPAENGYHRCTLEVEVENTSFVPIRIINAPVFREAVPGTSHPRAGSVDVDAVPDGGLSVTTGDTTIPAHTTWRRHLFVDRVYDGDISPTGMQVTCCWVSSTKLAAARISEYIAKYYPDYWRPGLQPEEDVDVIPMPYTGPGEPVARAGE